MILMADNACRCKKNNKGMSGLPGSPPHAKEPTSKADSHHVPMAILQIEAKPLVTIIGNQIKKFVWENIVCRFGLAGEIISDNENQFRDNPFKDWCEKLCIRQRFTSVKHPQANDMAHNDEALDINHDLLEERKEQAAIREARSKSKMEKYYNSKVRNTSFKPGDMVY
nr:reverse transcriptase domain-containing protein [Tanacetum cinerariifolium]